MLSFSEHKQGKDVCFCQFYLTLHWSFYSSCNKNFFLNWGHSYWKQKEVKLSLFVDGIIVNENPKEYPILQELIKDFKQYYKSNEQKLVTSLYPTNDQAEIEMKKTII